MEKENSAHAANSPPKKWSQCAANVANLLQASSLLAIHMKTQKPPDSSARWCLEDFEIGKPLGWGRFGKVYVAREKTTQWIVALKVIHKTKLETVRSKMQVRREIEIQGNLRHPNIIRMHGYFYDDDKIYLILEYAFHGELYRHLNDKGRFSERESAELLLQAVNACVLLHSKNIIHRDLKLENIMVAKNGDIKIGDFGWSVHAPTSRRDTFCGTPGYVAPEIAMKQPYDEKVDVWSIGVLLYEFLVGNPPFDAPSQDATFNRIVSVDLKFPSDPSIADDARDLIRKFLVRKPSLRIPLKDVANHPWVLRCLSKNNDKPVEKKNASTNDKAIAPGSEAS